MNEAFPFKAPGALLLGICCCRILIMEVVQNYPPLIPTLKQEWQMSSAAAGSIISAFQIGFLVSLVGLSALTDWVSARKVFLYSCLASAASSLLFALFARSYFSALILRGLMGLALGGTYTPGLKLLSELFPSSLRGRAMGFFIGSGSMGMAISLALTGWIAAHYGWPAAFLATSLVPFLGGALALIVLRGIPDKEAGESQKGRGLRKELLANKPALLLIGGYSVHVWELEGMRAWTPAFLVACFLAAGSTGELAMRNGASLSSLVILMGVFSTAIAGFLSDRLGRTAVIIALMAASVLCSFSFGWLIGGSMVWIAAVGLGYGFTAIAESPVLSSALSEVISPKYLGTALGIRSLVGFAMAGIVPTVFGAILDLTNPGGGEGYLRTWGWAFCTLGGVALLGPWMMWKLRFLPESRLMAGGKK